MKNHVMHLHAARTTVITFAFIGYRTRIKRDKEELE